MDECCHSVAMHQPVGIGACRDMHTPERLLMELFLESSRSDSSIAESKQLSALSFFRIPDTEAREVVDGPLQE